MMEEVDKEKLSKLRLFVEDIQSDLTDFDLLRWLHGHDNNLDIVVPKLRACLTFNKQWDFKQYRPNPVVLEYLPKSFLGVNRKVNNNLVYLDCSGRFDVNGVLKAVPKTEAFKTQIYIMEQVMVRLREHENLLGKPTKFVLIIDHEHMKFDKSLVNFVTGDYKDLCTILMEHYVESYETIINVNLPSFLPYLWKLFKVFLPKKTKKQIVLLGHNWRHEILKYVDADILPEHWGGTLTDGTGDPMCPSIVKMPSHVPEHVYWTPGPKDFPPDELTCLSIGHGRCEMVTVPVTKVGNVLEWYFTSDNGLHFGVYYTDDEQVSDPNDMDVIFPDFTFTCGVSVPERGRFECKGRGFYKFRFSNVHSWITTTKVRYNINCS